MTLAFSITDESGVLTVSMNRRATGELSKADTHNQDVVSTLIEAASYNAIKEAHSRDVFKNGNSKSEVVVIWHGEKIHLRK